MKIIINNQLKLIVYEPFRRRYVFCNVANFLKNPSNVTTCLIGNIAVFDSRPCNFLNSPEANHIPVFILFRKITNLGLQRSELTMMSGASWRGCYTSSSCSCLVFCSAGESSSPSSKDLLEIIHYLSLTMMMNGDSLPVAQQFVFDRREIWEFSTWT